MVEAAKTPRGAGESEKDTPAVSAEPSTRNKKTKTEERSFADMQEASLGLFDVPGYVLVGAAVGAGIDMDEPVNEDEMRTAVKAFLEREVK